MFDISSVQLDWKGLNLKLETGLMARQADGSVLATLGKTSVLCTVVASKDYDPTIDFFPLITSSVTSDPIFAGRQCINTDFSSVKDIILSLT